jgi:hypothetical protein
MTISPFALRSANAPLQFPRLHPIRSAPKPGGKHMPTSLGSRRFAFVLAAATVVAALVAAGCSEQGSAEQANAPVAITTQQTMITVQNNAGMPLTNVKLMVVAYGNTEFTKLFSRLENTERREIALGDLSSRDGTAFNPRLSKPKLVRLLATDATGKDYNVEVPWR